MLLEEVTHHDVTHLTSIILHPSFSLSAGYAHWTLWDTLIVMETLTNISTPTSSPALNFTARSTLPVGAGLGSSASFSTCAAAALLLVNRRLSLPSLPAPDVTHTSHQGRRAIPRDIAEEVNQYAFVAEKILHGNPSGVDNSVAVFGGALAYTRAGFGRDGGMEGIQGYVFFSGQFRLFNPPCCCCQGAIFTP